MAARKSSPALILLLVLAVPVLAAIGWYAFSSGDAEPGAEGLDREVATETEAEDGGALADAPRALVPDAPLTPVADRDEGVREDVVQREREEERAAARAELETVTGRVVFDFAVPTDEVLYVLSLNRSMSEAELYDRSEMLATIWESGDDEGAEASEGEEEDDDDSGPLVDFARVAKDGTFEVGALAGRETAHLALTGRYIYSRQTRAAPADGGDVVLTGELGAWLQGRLTTPGAEPGDERLAGVQVGLGPDITAAFDAVEIQRQAYAPETETDADGRFEFRAVSDSLTRAIFTNPDELSGILRLGIQPIPGERQELSIALQQGATLRGTVVGEDGEPIPDTEVQVTLRGALAQIADDLREATTDAEGRFEMEHVLTGRQLQLVAKPEGWRAGKLTLEEKLRDGQVLERLVVRCDRGLSVEGRVVYADGSPAPDADVRLSTDLSSVEPAMLSTAAQNAMSAGTETDETGRFAFHGLPEGLFKLTARTSADEGDRAGSWEAREGGVEVRADRADLVLELEGLSPLRGLVSTTSDLPIGAFTVRRTRSGSGGMMGIGAERVSRRFDEPQEDGFTVKDVSPGTWEVVVAAEGFATSAMIEVEVPMPPDAEPPLFEIVPSSGVSGTVFDAAGKPVSGATVTIEADLGQRMSAAFGDDIPEALTDHEGKYLLEGLEPGGQSILARMTGFAASEARAVELVSGERVEGVDLELRLGGTIHGEVLGDDGDPSPGRMVIVQVVPNYNRQYIATSGPDGDFRFEHLEPGSWQVISMANPMTGELEIEGGEQDMSALLGELKMDMVDVVDGEEHWVTLGKPPEDPIQVLGSVAAGSEPIDGAIVIFVPEDSAGFSEMRMTTTDASGDFELTLEKRGPYLVTVQSQVATGRQSNIEFDEVIPEEGSTHRVAIKMPLGGIRGRVLDSRGDPAAGCRVTLNVDDGIRFGSFLGGHYSEIATEADGSYEIAHLRPGRYTVTAGGATMGGLLGDDAVAGRVVRSGLVVKEGDWLEDVDFRLKRPGTLTGIVAGMDGAPVEGAAVFVRDSSGHLLDHFALVTTDAAGKFTYQGVSEGDYRILAKKGDQVSQLSDAVHVKEGGSATAEVRLVEGTVMVLKVVDKMGTEFRARVSVRDEEGNEMCAMLTMNEILSQFGKGFSSKEQRVGPVPPGRYRVVATLDDGREASKTVTATGQTSRKVILRVK